MFNDEKSDVKSMEVSEDNSERVIENDEDSNIEVNYHEKEEENSTSN